MTKEQYEELVPGPQADYDYVCDVLHSPVEHILHHLKATTTLTGEEMAKAIKGFAEEVAWELAIEMNIPLGTPPLNT